MRCTPEKVDFRVVFKAVGDALTEPPPGDGPFGLSEPGTLEDLLERAGMEVLSSAEADCPFEYASFGMFWRAIVAAGPLQGALRCVGEGKLREAVRKDVHPYQRDDGSIRFDNRFRYVTAVNAHGG